MLHLVARRAAGAGAVSSAADVRLYDPYFCRGGMKGHLRELGFRCVINEKRDFYADIAARATPAHDALITNPPYSGEHKAWLFAWLLEQRRAALVASGASGGGGCGGGGAPFLLLLPAWTAKWLPWRTFLWAMARLARGKHGVTMEEARRRTKKLANLPDDLEREAGVFYYAPPAKYEYRAAVATGHEAAPFFGVWFCGGFASETERLAAVGALAEQEGRVLPTLKALHGAGIVTSAAEDAVAALASDPAAAKRKAEAIAKLEAARKLKPRRRNYDDREGSTYAPRPGEDDPPREALEAILKDERNAKACRHFFVGKGCNKGSRCRFAHELALG